MIILKKIALIKQLLQWLNASLVKFSRKPFFENDKSLIDNKVTVKLERLVPIAMFVSIYILSTGVMPRILMPLARTEHVPLKSCNLAWGTEEDKKHSWMSSLLLNPQYSLLKWFPLREVHTQ